MLISVFEHRLELKGKDLKGSLMDFFSAQVEEV